MSEIVGPDGRPADAPAVLPRAPVIWLSETEGIATARGIANGAVIGPFRILIQNNTDEVPPEHLLKYDPTRP